MFFKQKYAQETSKFCTWNCTDLKHSVELKASHAGSQHGIDQSSNKSVIKEAGSHQ